MKQSAISLFVTSAILTGCAFGGSSKVQVQNGADNGSGDILQIETFQTAIPEGDIVTDHGKEIGMSYGAVEGYGDHPANGIATAHYLEDGATILGVQANVHVPEEGFSYEAWAAAENPETPWISLGKLRNPLGDARHNVRFETPQDLSGYTILWLTLEPNDGNPAPAKPVAQARLKPAAR